MGWFKNHWKARAGKPISASGLRGIADTCDQVSRIKCQPPLEALWTPGGLLLRVAGAIFGAYVGVVVGGGISAMSGLTPGTGNVTLYTWNGTVLASLGITEAVYSISSTTGGIPAGTTCIILRIAGNYWLISADCGN